MVKSQKEHDKKKNLCYWCKKRKIAYTCGMCKRCYGGHLKKIEKMRKQIKDKRTNKKEKICGDCKKEITTKKDLKAYIDSGYCKPCDIKNSKWFDEMFGPW
jgi:uncharacterized CHY-type Zn-finger protein